MEPGFNPYAVLGVQRDATDKQIRQARHELVRKYHPDVNHSSTAAARFEEIQEAFDLLSDAARRAEYDRTHDEAGRARLVQAPDGGYHLDGEAYHPVPKTPSSVSVQPTSVDFGVLTPDRHTAFAELTIHWTGARPSTMTRDAGGEWWSVVRSRPVGLSLVLTLRAGRRRGTPLGLHQAQFTMKSGDTELKVDLSARFEGASWPNASYTAEPKPVPARNSGTTT
jgi:hypothetical protein